MSNKIDVYKEWLKIDAPNRPLNYYQLLKFKDFEDDPAVIRKRYRELNAYVRKFATGDYIDQKGEEPRRRDRGRPSSGAPAAEGHGRRKDHDRLRRIGRASVH